MRFSVRQIGESWVLHRKSAVLSAFFAVALIFTQAVEVSHAHDDHESQLECEICLQFGFSDDLALASANGQISGAKAHIDATSIFSIPATLAFAANSRAPPQSH